MSINNIKIVPQNPTRPLRIIFCLPGSSFSHNFLMSWSELLVSLPSHNIQPIISSAQDSVVFFVRNKCLGGDVQRGRYQKPFNGSARYDYMMWIDSDIVFTPESFFKLLSWDKDIVSGLYMMDGGRNFAAVKNWDEKFFEKHGFFEFLSPKDIEQKKDLMEVDYAGFGFMLIKLGVFESLEYPWFQPIFHEIAHMRDFSSEDVSFCKMIKEKGYKILVDPTVRVGHKKSIIY